MNRTTKALSGYAGGAGAVAATCAALCCAGAPIVVSVLAATGLGFLRNDAILLPVIAIAIGIALWGLGRGSLIHGCKRPLILGAIGSLALAAGVVFLHGTVAKACIGAGAIALLASTVWNSRLMGQCDAPVPLSRARPDV